MEMAVREKIMSNIIPKISVVIPCFNHGEYLEDAITSVLLQTFRNFEIIVINDGSTDIETINVINKLTVKYKNVTFINQKNGHLANARNAGISIARGEFILPLDADDKIMPTMLEKCLNEIEKDEKIGFVYTWVRFFGNYNAIWRNQDYNFYDLLNANYIVATSLIRRSVWELVGGYDEKMKNGYEDWEFLIAIGEIGWFGKLIKEPLFCYRRKSESMVVYALKNDKNNISYIKKKHCEIFNDIKIREIKKIWGSFVENENIILRKFNNLKISGVFSFSFLLNFFNAIFKK